MFYHASLALCGWLLADTFSCWQLHLFVQVNTSCAAKWLPWKFHKHFISFRDKNWKCSMFSSRSGPHYFEAHVAMSKSNTRVKARHVFRWGVSWFERMCPHAFVSKWWVWSRHSPAWTWPTVQFYSVLVMRVCTCIRALSTSQRRWRGGYIDSFCRSRRSTQGRGLACWPGKPHPAADCPVACSDHWGVRPSCSLRAENEKRIQWKMLLNYSEIPPKHGNKFFYVYWSKSTLSLNNVLGSIYTDQTNH